MRAERPPGPVVIDPAGPSLSALDREMIAHPAVGGVILFGHNVIDLDQVRALIADCRAARGGPLLVMVDQEGGRVQRLRKGFSRLPEAARFGRRFDDDPARALAAARDVGQLCGRELRSAGIDLNLAPVADLGGQSAVIGDRAFHPEPVVAAVLAAAFVTGLHRAGVAATAKHYPGHGSVVEDTHHDTAIDRRSLAQIEGRDGQVFAALVRAGVDAVMPAHVIYPAVDERPAGYSARWIGERLRGALGFNGLVLSDDLSMAAAGVAGDAPARARAALAAGCDLALVCQRPEAQVAVIEDLGAQSADPRRSVRLLAAFRDPQAPADEDDLAERVRAARAWLR